MRTPRRLATLALAATAGLSLAACSSTVHATGSPAPTTGTSAGESSTPPAEPAGDTQTVPSGNPLDENLPEPGAGVPGDAGLCQAVVGWFGYVSLSLLAADDNGQVDPATAVPLLAALRDAPRGHQDASAELLALARDVSAATDDAIDQVQSGTDLYTAVSNLQQPVTDFAYGCDAAGVSY
jgi:hypothetical protein